MIQQTREGVLLRLEVQPRSSRNEIVGAPGDVIRIRLTAPRRTKLITILGARVPQVMAGLGLGRAG